MHPFLASSRRLLFYLVAWTPVLGMLMYISASGGTAPSDAAAVFAPACIALAFVCLSPWQICRIRPLKLSGLPGLLTTFSAAAIAGSLVFTGTATAMAYLLSRPAVMGPGINGVLFGIGVLLYLSSTGLHYAVLAAEASREAERNAAEARTLAREAELQSLRNQLNPHFLFNSLHSISALATLDGARAREMCIRLAGFLRSSLGMGQKESIPLRDELALARCYLEVEQVRFGERLRVTEEIGPACEDCQVPPLLLQPLVENAVKHGVAGLVEGASIRLFATRSGGDVSITLENGFDPDSKTPGNLGLGLAHVRRRLQVRYGEGAVFDAGPQGSVYRVMLRFPCESPIASSSRA
ncbi:MAG TPA: histidine kinase [Bryobacteraceae bacterium]|nr:histidine kinase [Bryobacteraceae bacterium]